MTFDYQRDTREYYQNAAVATAYHAGFAGAGGGWRTLRFRAVADRERAAIAAFLRRVPHRRILDLPAGTGKLAPVFAALGGSVVACDIAGAMLEIAQQEYAAAGCVDADFRICDAERLTATIDERFDVAVCLRLLHRVPVEARQRILAELAACADHAIVSMGIESGYHKVRRHWRSRLLGGGASALCYDSSATVRSQLEAHFEILATRWVLPGLSQEMVFLLRPKS
jgi:2-polyprenyl-3-methyl-5-hydroxy-6-metoxy-1,4-benzoquinol methylase